MNLINRIIVALKFRIKVLIDKLFFAFSGGGNFLVQCYYGFFSSAFSGENSAVFAGRKAYAESLKVGSESSSLVRRNVHRLEKGLIMRPRRSVFAAGYIAETMVAFQSMVTAFQQSPDTFDVQELSWAHDVLKEYFTVTDDSNPKINASRQLFEQLQVLRGTESKRKPYVRNLSQPPPISVEDLLALSKLRRSVRWYQQKPVPRQIVDRAIQVAAYAPSACNRQPFDCRIFDAPDRVAELASIPMGTAGFSHNFPGLIVIVGHLDAYFDERDRHVIYIDASLSAMSLMYAFEAQGVSTCAINWPDVAKLEKQMSKALNLKRHERVIMLMSYGFPDPSGMVPFSQKKSLDLLRSYNP
jgi:nitroreductase